MDDNAASEFVSGTLQRSAITKVETHLATCRDCRQLVAALAADGGDDSNVATMPHERLSYSQAGPMPTLSIGDRVGRYLVLAALGSGGMGIVFAAYDPQLDRKVALKLLRSGIAVNSKDARARLKREAQAIAQLSHPNVVGVYDVGATDSGDVYIAMEFVEGDTLTTWLKRWPRTWREIVDVFLQAGRGLVAAHSVGLLHRDFKPDNVLVGGDGRVRVTDFGLARSMMTPDEAARPTPDTTALNVALTATGTVLGTPRYMAPEQLTGPDIDARSDQFSFCVALYEALYGTHPLPGSTSATMLEKGERAAPPPEGSRVPPAIGRLVSRGLERDRSKRYPGMAALIAELLPVPARSPVRYAAIGLAGLVLVGAATAAVIVQREPGAPPTVDDKGVGPFVTELNRLKDQIKELEAERRVLIGTLEKRTVEVTELTHLREQLADKDEKIQSLVGEVSVLQAQLKPPSGARPRPMQSVAAVAAVNGAQQAVTGCLVEWAERIDFDNGVRIDKSHAKMTVSLHVTPDGLGHSADVDGPDSPILKMCVSEQIANVKFVPGSEDLELEVTVLWADGGVTLAPRVVGHRDAVRSLMDL